MTTPDLTESRKHGVPAINGLRGIAIIGVLWHHTAYKLWLATDQSIDPPLALEPLLALINGGWLGVNLFFVLSGFVLYLPYAQGERALETGAGWTGFYRRRAARLLPLFYVSLFAFWLLDLIRGKSAVPAHEAAQYLLLVFPFNAGTFLPQPNWVLWSLGIEIWFSVLFPFLVFAMTRYGVARTLVVCLIGSAALRLAGSLPEVLLEGARLSPLKDGVLGRLDDFVVGMTVCHAYVHNKLERIPVGALALGFVTGLATLIVWERVLRDEAPWHLIPLLHNGVQAGAAALLITALRLRGRAQAIFSNTPLQVIGMMCFSIYVWHGRPIELFLGPRFDVLHACAYAIFVALLAALSYRYIEFPTKSSWRLAFATEPKSAVANQRR